MQAPADPPTTADRLRRVCLATAAVLFAAAARGDLWFDEIWSIDFARDEARSALDVFRIFHDNNHPLNTLYLFFLGDNNWLYAYRAHAVLAGVLSVFLLGTIARRLWGSLEALFATLLAGLSYPLVVYFSEARGYALAILFSLCGFALWSDERAGWPLRRLLLFWGSGVFGILAHATCMLPVIAMAVSGLLTPLGSDASRRQWWSELGWQHVPVLLFCIAWYAFFLRRMAIGGSDPQSVWPELIRGSALALGLPASPGLGYAALAAILGIVCGTALRLRRAVATHWRFYLVLIAGASLIAMAASRSQSFQFRYLLLVVPFVYLMAARIFGLCFRSERKPLRRAAIGLLGLSLLGHATNDYAFLRSGRGNYEAALRTMLERSPTGAILVGSDHDFRNLLVLEFYAHRIPGGAAIRYLRQSDWAATPPDWFIAHTQDVNRQPPDRLELAHAANYALSSPVYEYSGVSGWRWFVYERLR